MLPQGGVPRVSTFHVKKVVSGRTSDKTKPNVFTWKQPERFAGFLHILVLSKRKKRKEERAAVICFYDVRTDCKVFVADYSGFNRLNGKTKSNHCNKLKGNFV